jgi:hypothetical protein
VLTDCEERRARPGRNECRHLAKLGRELPAVHGPRSEPAFGDSGVVAEPARDC